MTKTLEAAELYTHTHTHTHTHTGKPCQIIFSTILILGAIGRVSAEPTNTSNSFPLDELMQPDYRYLNSAIYPNTGVYDGDVTVNALYDWDLFSPTAGNYLPANSTTITTCTSGNFCAGATNVHYDSIDQGITACSTLGDNSYTQSAVGSSLETDCYRNCSGNVTIEHATTITGNDYYGNGVDTCSASACENGYHTDNNACGANVLTITWANSDNPNTTCTYGGSITTPATAPTIPGKTFVGWAMGYDFSTLDVYNGGTWYESYSKGGYSSKNPYHEDYTCMYTDGMVNRQYKSCDNGNYDDLNLHEWRVSNTISMVTIYGVGKVSAKTGNNNDDTWNNASSNWTATDSELDNATGTQNNCWCKLTGYKPNSVNTKLIPSNTLSWIYAGQHSETYCAMFCSAKFITYPVFRSAMLGQ